MPICMTPAWGTRRGRASRTCFFSRAWRLGADRWHLAAALCALAAAGCGRLPGLGGEPTAQLILGTVAAAGDALPPPGALLRLDLLDVTTPRGAFRVAAQDYVADHRMPIPFAMRFDPRRVDAGRAYALRARVYVDGDLRFTADETPLVLSGGRFERAVVVVEEMTDQVDHLRRRLDRLAMTYGELALEGEDARFNAFWELGELRWIREFVDRGAQGSRVGEYAFVAGSLARYQEQSLTAQTARGPRAGHDRIAVRIDFDPSGQVVDTWQDVNGVAVEFEDERSGRALRRAALLRGAATAAGSASAAPSGKDEDASRARWGRGT